MIARRSQGLVAGLRTKKFKFETQVSKFRVLEFTSKIHVLFVPGLETFKEFVHFLLESRESAVEDRDVVTKFLDHLILSCQLRSRDINSSDYVQVHQVEVLANVFAPHEQSKVNISVGCHSTI